MRTSFIVLWLAATMAAAWAVPPESAAVTPPYEITKNHVDIEVAADGTYLEAHDETYRILNSRGIDELHERKLEYTQGFEELQIVAAYTLKADGRRIDVPPNSVLVGFGQTSRPGFRDNRIVSIFFPNLEVGDSIALVTVHRQLVPWFAGRFDWRVEFSPTIVAHDVRYAFTAPAASTIQIDAVGLTGGDEQVLGGKKRWVWQFHNDTALALEEDAVDEADFAPHLGLTTFADYKDVARAYRELSKDATTVTPEIQALADQLTAGVADQKAQSKILYDWVSTHIAYVALQLGAGGFTPHMAKNILANRYGDCKDHVVLLQTLLAAKGIDSTPALIRAGAYAYTLANAPSPHGFDHVITYLPALDLYVDSTAELAPFGVLPYPDAGKPVLRVATGEVARTPTANSQSSVVRTVNEVTLSPDGSAEGHTRITARGAFGVSLRDMFQNVAAGKEDQFFREILGPGAEGTLDRGNPRNLTDPYVANATYRLPNAIAFPGPGALPSWLSFRPFYFTGLMAGNLPPSRNSNYVCWSLLAEDSTTITLPAGVHILSLPDSQIVTADDIRVQTDYDRTDPRTITQSIRMSLDHPQGSCTPAYYAKVHDTMKKITNLLHQQIVYRGAREAAQ